MADSLSMKEVASMLHVGIGRTKLMAFLRYKRLIDASNRLVPNSMLDGLAFQDYIEVNNGRRMELALRVSDEGFEVIKELVSEGFLEFLQLEISRKLRSVDLNKHASLTVPAIYLENCIPAHRIGGQNGN